MSTSATTDRAGQPGAETAAPSPARGPWMRFFHGLLWAVTVGLLLLALLRVAWHDGYLLLTIFNAFTLYVYLPAYGVLLIALSKSWWRLAGLAALVVAFHLGWVAPDFQRAASAPATTPGHAAPTLRVFFANISQFNPDFADVFEEIAAANPDVVVFAELNRRLHAMLRESEFIKTYPYGSDVSGRFPGEVAVFSRVPTGDARPRWVTHRPYLALDIPIGTGTLRLFALHSPRPIKGPMHQYYEYWGIVLAAIAEQPRPLVVIGDFNATQHSAVYRALIAMGLRSAFVDRGLGYTTSWPNGLYPLPPIRIDHAFISADVECVDVRNGIGEGSDHKPIILDVRLRRDEARKDNNVRFGTGDRQSHLDAVR